MPPASKTVLAPLIAHTPTAGQTGLRPGQPQLTGVPLTPSQSPGRRRSPLAFVAGGAVGLAAVVVLAVVLLSGKSPQEDASRKIAAKDTPKEQAGTKKNAQQPAKGGEQPQKGGEQLSDGKKAVEDPIATLTQKLKGGDLPGRVAAARELAKLGKAAQPATRALCEMATEPSDDIRSEALEALEKVAPSLYPHAVTLLVDKQVPKQTRAVQLLARMGDEARPAVPLILHHLKKVAGADFARLKRYDTPGEPIGRGNVAAMAAVAALGDLAPTEPPALDAIIGAAKAATDDQLDWEVAAAPWLLLADIVLRHPEQREKVVPVLVGALSDQGGPSQDRRYVAAMYARQPSGRRPRTPCLH